MALKHVTSTELTHTRKNANKHNNNYRLLPLRLANSKHFITHRESTGVRKLECTGRSVN